MSTGAVANYFEQEQEKNNKNQMMLEKILDKVTILEERSKIKNEHLIGYYTIDDLVKKLQISSGTIYGEISKDTFPKQIKIGVRNSLWCKKEMHAWMVINASRGREYILNKKWSNIYAERYALKF